MLGVLALLFLVVPFLELFVIVQVGQSIGVVNTLGALVLVSVTGAWLVRREGLGLLRRARLQMNQGRVPAAEVIDGVLVIVAGALLLTPGFLTDLLGLLLLLPPVRASMRHLAARRLSQRVVVRRYR